MPVAQSAHMPIPWSRYEPTELRLQLARMLNSRGFRRATRLRALLAFLVEQRITFGDRPIGQKELAAQVLGKDAGFNPTSEAHARIYVRRLRHAVEAYYAGEGSSDLLVFEVTTGPYRLSVTRRAPAEASSHAPGGKPSGEGIGLGLSRGNGVSLLLITEFAAEDLDPGLTQFPLLLAVSVAPYLLGQDGLAAIGPLSRDRLSDPVWKSPAVAASAADYLLDGTIACGPFGGDGRRPIDIVSRLYDTRTGDEVWTRSLTDRLGLHADLAAASVIAARLAAVILTPGS